MSSSTADALTVSDVLRRAEQVIAERGWLQGDFTDDHGAVCARGAINIVVTGVPYHDAGPDPLVDDATKALAEHLGGHSPFIISDWNDLDTTTESEVRAALLAAAQAAEAGDD